MKSVIGVPDVCFASLTAYAEAHWYRAVTLTAYAEAHWYRAVFFSERVYCRSQPRLASD